MQIDLKTAQLLNSRLFHDLVGSASAIHTGLEFLVEADGINDAINLIQKSAYRLNGRLDFFRAAFGKDGGRQGGLSLTDAGGLAAGWYADSKADLGWPGSEALSAVGKVGPTEVKVLLILVMLGEECLPRGGQVSVEAIRLVEGLGFAVRAQGTGAKLPNGVTAAFDAACSQDMLTARNVTAHFCCHLAASARAKIKVAEAAETVELAVFFPGFLDDR